MIAARMRSGGSWSDVRIRNVSSRGILLEAETPPPPGSYVEIRRGSVMIIGRTVWSKPPLFGIRTQDRIDIKALIAEPRVDGRPSAPKAGAESDRRSADRKTTATSIAQRLERSRRIASVLQFGLFVGVAVVIAGIAASQVYAVLARPFAVIASKL
jgi:hypothetical protein